MFLCWSLVFCYPGQAATILAADDRVFFYGDSSSIFHAVSAANKLEPFVVVE